MESTAHTDLTRQFGAKMGVAESEIITFGKRGHPKQLLCIEAQGEGSPRTAESPISQRKGRGEAAGITRCIVLLPRQAVGRAVGAEQFVPMPMVQQTRRE